MKPAGTNPIKKKRTAIRKAAATNKPQPKKQKHPRKSKFNWEPMEQAYIYGEKAADAPETSMPVYPTFATLSARFGVPSGTISCWAVDHEWTRRKAEARIQIEGMVHQAMLRQAASRYIPLRAAAVELIGQAFTEAPAALKGDSERARAGSSVMDMVDKGLKNLNAAMGIKEAPAIAIQLNAAFVAPVAPGADAPPPEHAQAFLGANLSGSIFGQILAAREATAALSDGLIASLEESSPLPAHLSAVPNGR